MCVCVPLMIDRLSSRPVWKQRSLDLKKKKEEEKKKQSPHLSQFLYPSPLCLLSHRLSALITACQLNQAFMWSTARFRSDEDIITPSFGWWSISHTDTQTHTEQWSNIIISLSWFSLQVVSHAGILSSFEDELNQLIFWGLYWQHDPHEAVRTVSGPQITHSDVSCRQHLNLTVHDIILDPKQRCQTQNLIKWAKLTNKQTPL